MAGSVFLNDDVTEMQAYFRAEDMTDGLPIIVPERRRVEAFLDASGFASHSDLEIGRVAPLNEPVTIADVAVNAVMAGARPQDLGVILGGIEAMQDPAFALDKVQFTTNPVAPALIVSGPAVDELGIGSSNHSLGPGRHPNGAIGRAIRFVLRNLGGANDEIDHATHGQPSKYTFCLGESTASPWGPCHVDRGFSAEQSTVTMAGVENIINIIPITDRHKEMAGPLLDQLGRIMQAVGSNLFFSYGSPVVVLSPGQVDRLIDEGYDRKRLQAAIFEAGKAPVGDYKFGNYCLGKWVVEDDKILPCRTPDDVIIVVSGGGESLHTLYLQSAFSTVACTREVWSPSRLP
jgi:hypothetical protein